MYKKKKKGKRKPEQDKCVYFHSDLGTCKLTGSTCPYLIVLTRPLNSTNNFNNAMGWDGGGDGCVGAANLHSGMYILMQVCTNIIALIPTALEKGTKGRC